MAVHRVLQALQDRGRLARRLIAKAPNTRRARPCSTCPNGGNGQVEQVCSADMPAVHALLPGPDIQRRIGGVWLLRRRACSRNTPSSARSRLHDLAAIRHYHKARPALAGGQWQGDLWRFREGYDPTSRPARGCASTATRRQGAKIFALPYQPGRGNAGQGIRPLAVHRPRAGALAFRFDDPPRAELCPFPDAMVFMHPDDAAARPAQQRRGQRYRRAVRKSSCAWIRRA